MLSENPAGMVTKIKCFHESGFYITLSNKSMIQKGNESVPEVILHFMTLTSDIENQPVSSSNKDQNHQV